MRMIRLLVALVLLLLPETSGATGLPGEADPRFQAALDLWLADDDQAALPTFAELAGQGNRAAQVLLALVDSMLPLQGPWLARLPRAERKALMRQPGGVSGRSWMNVAAADTPLAATWVSLWRASDRDEIAIARAFAAMGEERAVREALIVRGLGERRGIAVLADDPIYPPSLRFLLWRDWAGTPAGDERIAAEVAALPRGDPQIAVATGRKPDATDRAVWLVESPSAAPLRAFCDATCPGSRPSCLEAAYAFENQSPELAAFGSPVESLVSSTEWAASPRGRAVVLRRTLPADPVLRARKLAEIAALNACFGAALAAEAARFVDQVPRQRASE